MLYLSFINMLKVGGQTLEGQTLEWTNPRGTNHIVDKPSGRQTREERTNPGGRQTLERGQTLEWTNTRVDKD